MVMINVHEIVLLRDGEGEGGGRLGGVEGI